MSNKAYRRFYVLSLSLLIILSFYPIVNGIRIAYLNIVNGAVKPEQYAKYIVPYAALCLAIILFSAFQPLLLKLRRFSLTTGLLASYIVFLIAERFFEGIKIHTEGMSLVSTSSLTIEQLKDLPPATIDVWQASLCMVSPQTQGQSVVFASSDHYYYVMANNSYKIHYYLIALIIITMVCGLVYGIGRMVRSDNKSEVNPLVLQGVSTSLLVSLCIFANTTAFFREAQAIQTPMASLLTCLFFIALGMAVGVYTGSFLFEKKKYLGEGLPVFLSIAAVILMYIGEAAMMGGNLYRFGTGWFFSGLPVIIVAPVDILVTILAGLAAYLVLNRARKKKNWPGKPLTITSLLLCAIIAIFGISFSATTSNAKDDIYGCYEFDDCIYMNPLSSFMAMKDNMPYVYYINDDYLLISNIKTGYIEKLSALYERTPIAEDEFSKISEFEGEPFLFRIPDLSQYKERWLRAVFAFDKQQHYGLYQMDDEIWLARLNNGRLWSIYRLLKTNKHNPDDIERALEAQENAPEGLKSMTLRDVYDLSRRGEELTYHDFKEFAGKAVGSGFMIMRYEIEGGCVLIVHCDSPDSKLNYARLSKRGYDPFDESKTVDIRSGTQALAEYLNPLNSLTRLKIEDKHDGTLPRELIYEFDGYRYYLNTTRADRVFITLESGEELPLKQALEERRIIIEDAVANGLYNVSMEPVDNPMGGDFSILHHRHKFTFDNEEFYPSASFMYCIFDDSFTTYFDIGELIYILELQGRDSIAEKLRLVSSSGNLFVISGKSYIKDKDLADAGISVEVGWHLSSHTPVTFSTEN